MNTLFSKSAWPELIGRKATEAKQIIESEVPNLEVQIVPEETHVGQDLRMDRVRIFVNQ